MDAYNREFSRGRSTTFSEAEWDQARGEEDLAVMAFPYGRIRLAWDEDEPDEEWRGEEPAEDEGFSLQGLVPQGVGGPELSHGA